VFNNVLKRDDSPEQVGAGSQAGMMSKRVLFDFLRDHQMYCLAQGDQGDRKQCSFSVLV